MNDKQNILFPPEKSNGIYLSEDHRKILETESAISSEIIAATGYQTIAAEDAHALGMTRDVKSRVLYMPIRGIDRRIVGHCFRPDIPRVKRGSGKVCKYELASGQSMSLHFSLPDEKPYRDPAEVLWITEGTKKADALASRGSAAIAVMGVWNWKGTNQFGGKTTLPQWHDVALEARKVYIAYDSDIVVKQEVKLAMQGLGGWLTTAKGAEVYVADIPPAKDGGKQGVDDYLAAGGNFGELIESSRQFEPDTKGDKITTFTRAWQWIVKNQPIPGLFWNDFTEAAQHVINGKREGLSSTHTNEVFTKLQSAGIETSLQLANEAILAAALVNRGNPLAEYLKILQWDGKHRLEEFFVTALGCDDNEYTSRISKNFFCALVARAFQPGIKFDNMVVLEGKQGIGKSSAFRALGGEYYAEISISMDSKDFLQALRGKWLLELGEMDSARKVDVTRIKQVLSCQVDYYRESYGHRTGDFKRRCVIVGTTNREEYLHDETGARRFWPIKATAINLQWIKENREQAFAEAVQLFHSGFNFWEVPEALAVDAQDERLERDAWEEIILDFISHFTEITMSKVFLALDIPDKSKWTMIDQKRIGRILTAAGWEKRAARRDGILLKVWFKKT